MNFHHRIDLKHVFRGNPQENTIKSVRCEMLAVKSCRKLCAYLSGCMHERSPEAFQRGHMRINSKTGTAGLRVL
eukprot:8448813-Pyramimonas_sp.AAC.1